MRVIRRSQQTGTGRRRQPEVTVRFVTATGRHGVVRIEGLNCRDAVHRRNRIAVGCGKMEWLVQLAIDLRIESLTRRLVAQPISNAVGRRELLRAVTAVSTAVTI